MPEQLKPAVFMNPQHLAELSAKTQGIDWFPAWNADESKGRMTPLYALPDGFVELLERIAHAEGAADWNGCDWGAIDELRALLGKDGEA